MLRYAEVMRMLLSISLVSVMSPLKIRVVLIPLRVADAKTIRVMLIGALLHHGEIVAVSEGWRRFRVGGVLVCLLLGMKEVIGTGCLLRILL